MRHVDARSDETHTLTPKPRAMVREGRRPISAHDAMARHGRIVAGAHDVSHGAGRERSAGDDAHQTVGRDTTRRDPRHDTAHQTGPRIHIPIMAKRRRAYREGFAGQDDLGMGHPGAAAHAPNEHILSEFATAR